MNSYEYMCIPVNVIPVDIMEQYNVSPLVVNGFILVEIRKGMYGLLQAGIIANKQLQEHLPQFGYFQCKHTPGLYRHTTRPTSFTLVVDYFGIKYRSKEDDLHLLACLRKKYEITTDWKGERYIAITLVWDYVNRWLDLSMPGYIEKAFKCVCTPPYKCNQYSPHDSLKPQYGASAQMREDPDLSPFLDSNGKYRLQEIIGTILYHVQVINSPLIPALGSIASEQSEGTEATAKAVAQLLDYCATYPNPTLRYRKSDMILRVHSDASYLSCQKYALGQQVISFYPAQLSRKIHPPPSLARFRTTNCY